MYIVNSGRCISHIGEGGNIRARTGALRRLGTHRGSDEVLCAAHYTGEVPTLHWVIVTGGRRERREKERELKRHFGEPPTPRKEFASCVDGRLLCRKLTNNAEGWRLGYILASFEIGEKLSHLFHPSFDAIWSKVGKPPGWEDFIYRGNLHFPIPPARAAK